MDKKNILTYEGLKKLEDELQNLKVVKRKEVAQKIKEAREQGDLSENAEYDAAKDEQRDIEARIEEIEKILKNAEVVVEEEVDLEKISIGCKVKILDCEFNDELEYKIVNCIGVGCIHPLQCPVDHGVYVFNGFLHALSKVTALVSVTKF